MATSFMSACKEFFGLKPGQSALDFGKELKALTAKDRMEIAEGLEKNGIEFDPATVVPK